MKKNITATTYYKTYEYAFFAIDSNGMDQKNDNVRYKKKNGKGVRHEARVATYFLHMQIMRTNMQNRPFL